MLAADLYDRLATGHPRRRSNVEVLHVLRTKYSSWIDPIVMRALLAVAPPFPPGCRLRLSDGTCAIVLHVEHGDPYFPIVRRVAEENWQLEGEQIDLSDRHAPRIESVGETKVRGLVPS
jgi:hypothetical protein